MSESLPAVIECGDPRAKTHAAKETLLAEAPHQKSNFFGPVSLQHVTEGYVVAGSAMRHQKECYRVTYMDTKNQTRHGKSFLVPDKEKADAYFDQVRDPQQPVARHDQKTPLPDVPHLSPKVSLVTTPAPPAQSIVP